MLIGSQKEKGTPLNLKKFPAKFISFIHLTAIMPPKKMFRTASGGTSSTCEASPTTTPDASSSSPQEPQLQLLIRDTHQKSGGLELKVARDTTVGDLKKLVQEQHESHMPAQSQKLIIVGQLASDGNKKVIELMPFVSGVGLSHTHAHSSLLTNTHVW